MMTRAGTSRPSDWVDWLCNLGWLGTVGSAAAVALARVLALASVIAGLATAFALAVVLPFAGMLVTLLVIDKQQAGAGLRRRLGNIDVVVLSGEIVSAGESWHADGQQSGHGSREQSRLGWVLFHCWFPSFEILRIAVAHPKAARLLGWHSRKYIPHAIAQ